MKLLYVTDLHGIGWKYDRLFDLAKRTRADVVINGGDMLPKTGDLFKQGNFITDYLSDYFDRFDREDIFFLCYLGNDDLKIFDELFDNTCRQFPHIINLAQKKHEIGGFEFIGMNYVVDYPFRLKDRCLRDTAGYVTGQQYGTALISGANGWQEIPDWSNYIKTLPTLDEEVKHLPIPADAFKSVYIIHMPPSRIGLDVCYNGEKVEYEAIYTFLAARQPKLALHGHIHESPEVSGLWQAHIGNTICVQPGQSYNDLVYVEINLPNMKIERKFVRA